MRVALITEQLLAPVPGGTGRYTAELGRALAASAAPGDTVTGWTAWHRDRAAARIDAVRGPRRLPLPRRPLSLAWARGLGPRPLGADLVHAPSPLFPPGRRPLVVNIHDAVPWTHPETLTPHGARWHREMGRRAVRDADAVLVLTATAGAELLRVLPGLAADRVHVSGVGIAPQLLAEPDPEQTRAVARRLQLPERYLLSLATLEPRKGLDVLIAAVARLGPAAPPLLVVGQPGWGDVDLEREAARAGLPPGAVRALGRLPDAQLGVVLRRASALVMPSRAEGFGLPVIEAMACSTPVICSDIPVLREVGAGAAELFPVGDDQALAERIDGLLGDGTARAELVRAGLDRAADFRWERVAERCWQIYSALN